MPDEFIDGYDAIAYCAACRRSYSDMSPWLLGTRFRCDQDRPDARHVAAVIQPKTMPWLHALQAIADFQLSRWHPRILIFRSRTELAALCYLVALLVALTVAPTKAWPLSMAIAIITIVDVLVQTTVAVFITQTPRLVVRSILLGLFGFVQLAIGVAVIIVAGPNGAFAVGGQCPEHLGRIDALYFSFVTMTTLGYGDILPCAGRHVGKLFVVMQVCMGLFYLSGLFASMVGWAAGVPATRSLRQLSRERE